jgi:prefoldin subunit 5
MFDQTFIDKEFSIIKGVEEMLNNELKEINAQLEELHKRKKELTNKERTYKTRLEIIQSLSFFNEFASRPFYQLLKERERLNAVTISDELSVKEYNKELSNLKDELKDINKKIKEVCSHDFYIEFYHEGDYYSGNCSYQTYNCVFCYKEGDKKGAVSSSNYRHEMKLEDLINVYFKDHFYINNIHEYINKRK